jgi:hypothetical protein
MKKWAIHTLFMSIILGFCQKIHTFSLPTSIGGFRGPGPMFADVRGHPLTLNIDLGFLEVVDSIFMKAKSRLQPFSFFFKPNISNIWG